MSVQLIKDLQMKISLLFLSVNKNQTKFFLKAFFLSTHEILYRVHPTRPSFSGMQNCVHTYESATRYEFIARARVIVTGRVSVHERSRFLLPATRVQRVMLQRDIATCNIYRTRLQGD